MRAVVTRTIVSAFSHAPLAVAVPRTWRAAPGTVTVRLGSGTYRASQIDRLLRDTGSLGYRLVVRGCTIQHDTDITLPLDHPGATFAENTHIRPPRPPA